MAKKLPQSKKSPADLPRRAETWLLTVRKLSRWVEMSDGLPVRPYLIFLVDLNSELILDYELNAEQPEAQEVLGFLWRAMLQPARELRLPPHRPQEILCDEAGLVEALAEDLSQAGVALEYQPASQALDKVIGLLEEELGEAGERPGLLNGGEITPELAGELFAAAALAYRQEPWIYLNTEQPLRYAIPALQKSGYVQLMGNSAIEYGLLLYDNWQDLERSYLNTGDPRPTLPETGWVSFSYTTPQLMSPDDLQAIKAYGWEVADEQAYPLPLVMFEERVERPDARTLQAFSALLRAVPQFTQALVPDDRGDYLPLECEIPVQGANGELLVQLEYPAGKLRREAFPVMSARQDIEQDNEEDRHAWDESQLELALQGEMPGQAGVIDRPDQAGYIADEEDEETIADWQSSPLAAANPDLVRAMVLIYQAWDEMEIQRRVELARQALEISADCAEAYLILGDELAVNLGQALKYYEKGCAAGERALGQEFFERYAGQFWQHVEARPYLRARAGLARTLWELERFDEALAHLHELLRLDESDALDCRYGILLILLDTNRLDQGREFALQNSDGTTTWLYTLALLEFQHDKTNGLADERLQAAIQSNPNVPAYLSGRVRLPERPSSETSQGQKGEAIDYAENFIHYWRRTPGAIDWLRKLSRAGSHPHSPARQAAKRKRRK